MLVSFTWNVRSRHNKWWKVVQMSTSNLFGKPLDSRQVVFNVRICHKLYSCYFTFSKLINLFSPMENQSYREREGEGEGEGEGEREEKGEDKGEGEGEGEREEKGEDKGEGEDGEGERERDRCEDSLGCGSKIGVHIK